MADGFYITDQQAVTRLAAALDFELPAGRAYEAYSFRGQLFVSSLFPQSPSLIDRFFSLLQGRPEGAIQFRFDPNSEVYFKACTRSRCTPEVSFERLTLKAHATLQSILNGSYRQVCYGIR